MKNIFSLITSIIVMFSIGCAQSQNEGELIKSMLRDFYIAHSKIWSVKPPFSLAKFDNSLDSLQQKYCTNKLRMEAKKFLKRGHDLLTNDWGIKEEDIKTLKVKKDLSKKNVYIVTYTTGLSAPNNIAQKKDVSLLVSVIRKPDGSYKINKVW